MIERALRGFEPTHALVCGPESDSIAAESALVEAVAETVAELAVEIDPLLGEDHPNVVAALDSTFERIEDDSYVTYCGSLSDPDRLATLSTLLSIDDWHRGVSIRTLVLSSQGGPRLRYIPDHRSLELDVRETSTIESVVHSALDNHRALVVPTETVAKWTHDGTKYALSPPWLCAGRGCLRLSRLAGIESDPEAREIELHWSQPSYSGVIENTVIRPLVGTFSLLTPKEPGTIRLPDQKRYLAIESTLRGICRTFQ